MKKGKKAKETGENPAVEDENKEKLEQPEKSGNKIRKKNLNI